MPAVVWDQLEDRVFEAGLDHGVLYFPDGGGVAWNGLTSVEEIASTSAEPTYFDGTKFNDVVVYGDFSATLRAFTYPDEFLEFEGILEDQDGLLIADQPLSMFHLTYRTMINNEGDYKIHMLWNLIAIPSNTVYTTLSLDTEPTEFEWTLTAVPEPIDNYRATAHVILDSRKLDPYLLEDIETILYGDPLDEERFPTFPSLKGFISYIRKWNRFIIVDNNDGTWTAVSRDDEYPIEMLDVDTFEITSDTALYLSSDTYEISSSEKNEEDI